MVFLDRSQAGRLLAARLAVFRREHAAIVLALPRGGVPVGFEIARALDLPLDVFMVRKLGVPGQPELALGAIASGGLRVLNDDIAKAFDISQETIDAVTVREQNELERRERQYRGSQPGINPAGRIVLLTDDGLATGSSMRAAARALRRSLPASIIVAVPVGAPETCATLAPEVDRIVCLEQPEQLGAVGQWYARFEQVSDAEVRTLLHLAATLHSR